MYCCWPCSARLRYLLYFFSSPSVKTAGRESSLAAMYGLVRGLLSASASRSCRGHRDRKLGKPLVYRHRSFCSGEKMPCSELELLGLTVMEGCRHLSRAAAVSTLEAVESS